MKRWSLFIAVAAVSLVAVSCGGGSETTTADTTAATEPTVPATEPPASTAAPATTAAAATTQPAATTGGEGTTIEVIGLDEAFSVREITVAAGEQLTVIFNNKDTSGEPHNIHFRTPDNDWFTTIQEAPDVQELTFTINEPGEYEFFCDTHLDTMEGTLIVTGS